MKRIKIYSELISTEHIHEKSGGRISGLLVFKRVKIKHPRQIEEGFQ
jgi:hypothetical protein